VETSGTTTPEDHGQAFHALKASTMHPRREYFDFGVDDGQSAKRLTSDPRVEESLIPILCPHIYSQPSGCD